MQSTFITTKPAKNNYNSPLLKVWSVITDELVVLQDQLTEKMNGFVANPINGSFYIRDTAFAAQIFATEYRRTNDSQWLKRAKAALNALSKVDIYNGMDEPIWNRLGWHSNKGSMATTGMFLDAYWNAQELLDIKDPDNAKFERIFEFVESCHMGNGLFAHDSIPKGQIRPPVQNTTAMALYLMTKIIGFAPEISPKVGPLLSLTFAAIKSGQRKDGFWPYITPDLKQQLWFNSNNLKRFNRFFPFIKNYLIKGGDHSIYFGDAVHHCLVLYYSAKCSILLDEKKYIPMLEKGWSWIKKCFKETSKGGLAFDFSWEPVVYTPRYCNFRETSTYFMILATMPLLKQLGIIESCEPYTSKFLLHIETSLLEKPGIYPSIKPYEAPVEILRNILPRVGESVAWKGGNLSSIMLDNDNSNHLLKIGG